MFKVQRDYLIKPSSLRPFLPQEQYTLCIELLQAYLDSFDTYANVKAL